MSRRRPAGSTPKAVAPRPRGPRGPGATNTVHGLSAPRRSEEELKILNTQVLPVLIEAFADIARDGLVPEWNVRGMGNHVWQTKFFYDWAYDQRPGLWRESIRNGYLTTDLIKTAREGGADAIRGEVYQEAARQNEANHERYIKNTEAVNTINEAMKTVEALRAPRKGLFAIFGRAARLENAQKIEESLHEKFGQLARNPVLPAPVKLQALPYKPSAAAPV